MADDLVKVLEGQSGLSSVCVSPDGVYIGNRNSGEVRRMSPDGELELVSSMGSVGGLVWREGQLLGADAAQQRVFRICGGAPSDLVTEVQGTALVGPNDVAVGPDGTIFFSDGGALGESPLANPRGSLYAVNVRGQTVTPVASSSLAQPSGVAVSSDGASLYLCETAQNRVLRYIQRPAGVWHGSVFFQFAGLFGPTCIDVDEHGNLYVGRCDLAGMKGRRNIPLNLEVFF